MSLSSTTGIHCTRGLASTKHLVTLAVMLWLIAAVAGCGTSGGSSDESGAKTVATTTVAAMPAATALPGSAFDVASDDSQGASAEPVDPSTSTDEAVAVSDDDATAPTAAARTEVAGSETLTGEQLKDPFDETVVTIGEQRADGWYPTSPDLPGDHGTLIVRPQMEPFATGDYRYQFLEAMPENGAYGDASPYQATLFQDIDRVWTPVTGVSDGDLNFLLESYLKPGQALRPPEILEANEIGEHLVGLRFQVPVHDFLSGAKVQDIAVSCSMNAGRAPTCTPDPLEAADQGPDLIGEDDGVVTRLCSYYDPEADPDIFSEPSLDAEKKMEVAGPDCAFFVRDATIDASAGWVPIEYKTDATTVTGWVQRETVGTRREILENYRAIREESPRPTLNPNETMLDTLSVLDYAVQGVELPADFGNVSDPARKCMREVWATRAEVLVDTGTISTSGCNLLGDVTGECQRILRFPDGGLAEVTIVYTADNPDYPITDAGIEEIRFGGIPTAPECAIGGD